MKRFSLIIIFLALFLCHHISWSQDKIAYSINLESNEAAGAFDFFGDVKKPLRFNFTVEQNPYSFEGDVSGRLVIHASKDSIISAYDNIVLDSVCTVQQFSYNERPIKHSLHNGEYYLFATFYAKDQVKFEKQSKVSRVHIKLYQTDITASHSWISYIKTSEYSEQITLHLDAKINLASAEKFLGTLNSQWEVGLGKKEGEIAASLNTFYRTDTLKEGENDFMLETSLFEKPNFEKYNFLIVKISSTYFSEGYRTIPDFTISLPLQLITDEEELVRQKKKHFPFLTYGKFLITGNELANASFDSLLRQAQKLYRFAQNSIRATKARKPAEALQWADSAFQFTGNHRLAALVYAPPGFIGNLYFGVGKSFEADKVFEIEEQRKALSMRQSEAMFMESLMTDGYAKLLLKILPDTLSVINEVEKSGLFEQQDKFRQDNIINLPVIWIERTLPAFEHFMRIRDLETVDEISSQAEKHIQLVTPLWNELAADTSLLRHYQFLANALTDWNEMLDFEMARLEYFTELGLYEDAELVIKEINAGFACSNKFQPDKFWLAIAKFYEGAGNFQKADSTLRLCDSFLRSKLEKEKDKVLKANIRLNMGNVELLNAKLNNVANTTLSKQMTNDLEVVTKESIFMQMDLWADQTLAQKLGFFGSPLYPNFYLNQIKRFETQNQIFQSNEWMKELAFFLGRDKRYNQALRIYENLFLVNNLQSLAFRLGFSEEAQIFFSQKQQQTFSRFINTVQASKDSVGEKRFNELLQLCLNQALFEHAFILRGNYQLLYDISRTDDEQVQKLYVIWQTLREHLNGLYVKDDPNKAEMKMLKEEIKTVESKLIRMARDTASMKLDYITPLDSIRNHLRDNEAAIEIIRYNVNHEVYYGTKSKYAAIVVKKTGPLELVQFPTEGALMEGRYYKFYRNAIRQKATDEVTYDIYWKPLAESLKNINKVYLAPDGVFHLINPNTLYNNSTQKYLLDEIEVSVVPTIANLKEEKPIQFKTAAILGNPVFNESSVNKNSDTIRTSRGMLAHQAISQLPGTKAEAEAIASLLNQSKSKVTLLTEKKANKPEIFSLKNNELLHLATHGFWIDNTDQKSDFHNLYETLSGSGLILSGAQRANKNDGFDLIPEGIITSAEIQDLNLFQTQLVVLSACETGLGEIIPGEGLYGLKRSLQKAGARNVITSLWKVDDEATKDFMLTFYRNLLETKNLSGAFDFTMKTLKKKYPAPYYWGAFVLTHN